MRAAIASFLRRYCGDEELAEDLAQDTLLRVTRSLPQFNGRSSVKTWALSIANRVAIDHNRKARRTALQDGLEKNMEMIDIASATEQRVIIDEMNDCVREVIFTLPEIYRSALLLRDLEGLSVLEIADICDCSLATAKIRIHRARKRLQKALVSTCEFYSDRDDILRADRR
ncbi:MAG: RNA polymerase sigma factor [Pseudomonadota bacterium]